MRHYKTSTSIRFYIYHLIESCTVYGRFTLNENKICWLCLQKLDYVQPAKLYNRKELVMTEIYINDFNKNFYIPEIKNPEFHLPPARILGYNHCVDTLCKEFKRRRRNQDVFCRYDYAERVLASFSH